VCKYRERSTRREEELGLTLKVHFSDLPLYALLALLVGHALSGTSSLSLPYLSTHLPHSIQTLLPTWVRQLPILAPFATDLPNASHDSKQGGANYWTTGYAGPFRSDAAGFGHPLTALHNFTRACLGLSYRVVDPSSTFDDSLFHHSDNLRFGHSYVDRYPWNSWTSYQQVQKKTNFLEATYRKGLRDIFLVMTGILLFTVIRALAIRYIFVPLGRQVVSSRPIASTGSSRLDAKERKKWRKERRKSVVRFSEQAWSVLYYICSISLGLFVAHSEPYWMNEAAIWSQWPYAELSGLTKVSSRNLSMLYRLFLVR
jgi:acyl-CoA-dependent ceramide synthase